MTFTELGIIERPDRVRYSAICPKCNKDRQKHKNALCLTVNNEPDNQWYHCNHCGWSGNLGNMEQYAKVLEKSRMPKEIGQVATYSKEVREYFAKRGIDFKVALKHKVYEFSMAGSPILGFPFYIGYTLVNVKFLRIRWEPGSEFPKWWQLPKEIGTKSIPWGLELLNFPEDEPKEIIWTEGEIDTLTWETAGYKNVLSVPQGAPNPEAKNFDHEFDYITDKYVRSVIEDATLHIFSTDNDAPGKVLRAKLAYLIGKEKCKYIQYPVDYKDINEVFKGVNKDEKKLPALGKSGVDDCYNNLSSFPLKGLIRPQDVRDELEMIASNGFTPGYGIGIPEIDELFTLKRKHFTVVTGLPSCFAGDQLIHTSIGVVPISEIKKGDKVLSYNHNKDRNEYCYVEDVLCSKNHPKRLYKITLKDGTIIKVTEDHKFFTGISYMQIKEILLSLKNNSKI